MVGTPPWETPQSAGAVILGRDLDTPEARVTITPKQFEKGCYVTGDAPERQTAMLLDWCVQWAELGRGFCYVHPRGPAPRNLLRSLPDDRLDDVVWIDYHRPAIPADFDVPAFTRVGLNPFDGPEDGIDADALVTDPVTGRVSDAMAAYSVKEDTFDWNVARLLATVLPWLVIEDELRYSDVDESLTRAHDEGTVDPLLDLAPWDDDAAIRTQLDHAVAHDEDVLRTAAYLLGLPFMQFASNPLYHETTYPISEAIANDRIVLVTGALSRGSFESSFRTINRIGTHLLVGTVARRLWEACQSKAGYGPDFPLVLDGIPELVPENGHRLRELLEHGVPGALTLVVHGPPRYQLPQWAQDAIGEHLDTMVVCTEDGSAEAAWGLATGDLGVAKRFLEAHQRSAVADGPLRWLYTDEAGHQTSNPRPAVDATPALPHALPPRRQSTDEIAQVITASVDRYGGIAGWIPEETPAEAGVE